MTLDDELLAHLELLKLQFASGLPKRLDRIDAALDACFAAPSNRDALVALASTLHSLAGAAGIFGLPALGEQARDAEHTVVRWMEEGCTSVELDHLRSLVATWHPAH